MWDECGIGMCATMLTMWGRCGRFCVTFDIIPVTLNFFNFMARKEALFIFKLFHHLEVWSGPPLLANRVGKRNRRYQSSHLLQDIFTFKIWIKSWGGREVFPHLIPQQTAFDWPWIPKDFLQRPLQMTSKLSFPYPDSRYVNLADLRLVELEIAIRIGAYIKRWSGTGQKHRSLT